MQLERVESSQILNSKVWKLSQESSLNIIIEAIKSKHRLNHIVVNAGKLVGMQKDRALYESVRNADMVNADGMSVVWASRFLGNRLPERVAGIDLMEELIRTSKPEGFKVFFFGAKEEVVSELVRRYAQEYGNEIIAGYRNGFYTADEELSIAQQIGESGADILFVAITSPKKEIFLNTYKNVLKVPFTMGVGGSFDVVAGITKRAPLWMQKIGLEWFYRFLQEPSRMWKRYLVGNTRFILLVFKQKMGLYKNPFSE
ncbi:MAG: WecB/TagA/CpsF family glycosyltransferase [Cyclobacteriaceae bacterium]